MSELKFTKFVLEDWMPKWDGKTEEICPQFPDGDGGAFDNLQKMSEYIECGGGYRFLQYAMAQGLEVIQDRHGYYVVLVDDNGIITDSKYVPTNVNDMLHSHDERKIAEEIKGKKIKDILKDTSADADRAMMC